MIKLIFKSFLFKISLICVIGAFAFYGAGLALEHLFGKAEVCPSQLV